MNFLILGAGGIGSFYGTKLIASGEDVIFVAREEHLKALQEYGLNLHHPKFNFYQKVKAYELNKIKKEILYNIDAVILTTKSISTKTIAEELSSLFDTKKRCPFIISLQNGVENEVILCNYFPKEKIICGLSRKIGAHIIKPGVIEVTGNVETIIGAIEQTKENEEFISVFSEIINSSGILCEVSNNIQLELWKKLIKNKNWRTDV